jgi:hypothetical protein
MALADRQQPNPASGGAQPASPQDAVGPSNGAADNEPASDSAKKGNSSTEKSATPTLAAHSPSRNERMSPSPSTTGKESRASRVHTREAPTWSQRSAIVQV